MPREEITNRRPTNYSQWHRRALPETCYYTDSDFFEQRVVDGNLVAVAAVETIQLDDISRWEQYPLFPSKHALGQDIEQRMGVPYFVVYHNSACSQFIVVHHGRAVHRFNETQMRAWLLQLRGRLL